MRIKKIMILAVAAIALAACSKTFDNVEIPQSPIDFGTWTNTLTKAYDGTWANNDAFSVFGIKTVGGAPAPVFQDVKVTYSSESAKWSYNNPQFWDLTASNYTFYAFLPFVDNTEDGHNDLLYSNGNYQGDPLSGRFSVSEVTFSSPATNAQDILIASKYSRDKGASSMPTGVVALEFNHITSLIDIKAKVDDAFAASIVAENQQAVITVTDVKLANIRDKGTCSVAQYNAESNKPVLNGNYGWAPTIEQNAEHTTDYIVVKSGESPVGEAVVVDSRTTYTGVNATSTTPAANSLVSSYILMPQNLNHETGEQQLVISYTVEVKTTGENPEIVSSATFTDKTVPFKAFVNADKTNNDGTAITAWEPGKHYTYFVTISAKTIEFSASVNPWTEVLGYNYLIN